MTERVKALIDAVRELDDDCNLDISSKQRRWLLDIFARADAGDYNLKPDALKFIETCANGFYSQS